jgi:methionyl-tRNA formyltransferase
LSGTLNAPYLFVDKSSRDLSGFFGDCGADIGVSINWPWILPGGALSHIPGGVINAHFGDLPRFRGNAVTNWALIMNEPVIVLTLHFMAPGDVDSGDIIAKQHIKIDTDTTIADITRHARRHIPGMFTAALDAIEANTLNPMPQQKTGMRAFRCWPRLPRDGRIEWTDTARGIHALVRALTAPYPGAYTYYRNGAMLEKLYVWESRIVCEHTNDAGIPGQVILNDKESGESHIFTGGGVIALRKVSHGGNGEPFAPGREWTSLRMRLGMDVEQEIFRLVRGVDE